MRVPLPALAVLVAAAIGCSSNDSSPTSSNSAIVGVWNLQTVNGVALPYILSQNSADRIEITADQLTFLKSGQFVQLTDERLILGGTTTTQQVPAAGTFTANGGSVRMVFTGTDSTFNGTVSGSTFTLAFQGIALRYQKQ